MISFLSITLVGLAISSALLGLSSLVTLRNAQ